MIPQALHGRADPCIPASRGPCAGAPGSCGQLVGRRVSSKQKNRLRDIPVRLG
jgi:hypothetical protein